MKHAMRSLGLMVFLAGTGVALAAEPVSPVGADTRAWLALQSSGNSADATTERPLPGEVADRIYQRYLKSFEQPIPAEFKRQQISSGGGGSGQ